MLRRIFFNILIEATIKPVPLGVRTGDELTSDAAAGRVFLKGPGSQERLHNRLIQGAGSLGLRDVLLGNGAQHG